MGQTANLYVYVEEANPFDTMTIEKEGNWPAGVAIKEHNGQLLRKGVKASGAWSEIMISWTPNSKQGGSVHTVSFTAKDSAGSCTQNSVTRTVKFTVPRCLYKASANEVLETIGRQFGTNRNFLRT